MNETLKTLAKETLKNLLSECTEGQQRMFKRMYAYNNINITINKAVDQMAEEKIDWAITQTERSIEKNKLSLNIESQNKKHE